jgi:hypothetical protein
MTSCNEARAEKLVVLICVLTASAQERTILRLESQIQQRVVAVRRDVAVGIGVAGLVAILDAAALEIGLCQYCGLLPSPIDPCLSFYCC